MTRRARLSRSRDFDAVYRKGRSAASRTLVLYVFRNEEDEALADDGVRLGLAVPRRVGDAVTRNHVKRKLREAFAEAGAELESSQDVVIVARPGAAEAIAREDQPWLVAELRSLLARTVTNEGVAA